ncbi:MAG: hypothetical protein RMX97_12825 [Nostoc sp. DedQUE11]|nr:hypothetical protein [Nostoc sp. DedQUE11]
MIGWVKEKWLKNLIFVCVFITILSCIALSPQISQPQQTNSAYSNIPFSEVSQPQLITGSLSSNPSLATSYTLEEVSVLSSSQLIPSAITSEEVMLREQQVKIAKEIEQITKLRLEQPNSTMITEDYLLTTYRRLDSEIQLLQAKQLLQLKQQKGDAASQRTTSKDI